MISTRLFFHASISAFALGALPGALSSAHAAAFYIQEQSVSGLGSAFAGTGALGEDASVMFYNPAGMTELPGGQIMLGAHILKPSARMRDTGTRNANGFGANNNGDDGGDPFDYEVIPNFYAAYPLADEGRLWAGIGVTAPFGLSDDYGQDWFGRYDSTRSELVTIDVAPSIAWALSDAVSIGLGINIQYAEAELERAIPSPLTAGGPDPSTDGLSNLSGDDISAGFNAGILLKPVEGTKVGLHYRSAISHELEGRLLVTPPSDTPAAISNIKGDAGLDLPDVATLSVAQDVTERLTLLGSLSRIGWNNFDSIPVDLETGTRLTTALNYEDTYAVAVGARYQASDQWTLRAGYQFDETPSIDGFRTTAIPDGDRQWFTAGASYQVDASWRLDIAAAYIDVAAADIALDETFTGGASSAVRSGTEGDIGILSLGVTYQF